MVLWQSLGVHLATKDVEYVPVSSPPFLSPYDVNDTAGFDSWTLFSAGNLSLQFYIHGENEYYLLHKK